MSPHSPMRSLIVLLLLIGSGVQAQDAGPLAKRVAMVGVGLSVSVGTVAATDGSAGGFLLAPLASALSIYGTGLALRGEGDFGGTLRGAALGALPALTLGVAGGLWLRSDGCNDVLICSSDGAALLLAGAVLYLIGPPVGAVIGFGSVEPVSGYAYRLPGSASRVRTVGLRLTF